MPAAQGVLLPEKLLVKPVSFDPLQRDRSHPVKGVNPLCSAFVVVGGKQELVKVELVLDFCFATVLQNLVELSHCGVLEVLTDADSHQCVTSFLEEPGT